jgi:hypothetical protein
MIIKFYNISVSFLCFIILISCSSGHNQQTKDFKKILYKFDTDIPKSVHLYVLIPAFSCRGCIKQSLNRLYLLLNEMDKPRVTIICSATWESEVNIFNSKANIYFDNKNYLDNTHMNIANLTIIITNNSQIHQIFTTNPENINRVINKNMIEHIREHNNSQLKTK